jgi:small GTP-binding protein
MNQTAVQNTKQTPAAPIFAFLASKLLQSGFIMGMLSKYRTAELLFSMAMPEPEIFLKMGLQLIIIERKEVGMPANLPPQYFETERKLKTAKTPEEKRIILEELLSLVPKHKGTEKLQALLKTKIAKLKAAAQKKPALAKHALAFHFDKTGAGQIILIGPANAGKSRLIKSLSNANPDIADYPFTTRTPYPAMMQYENIKIQLIDTPPIMPEYMEAWHYELIKDADGILFLLDLSSQSSADITQTLLDKLKEKKIKLIAEDQTIPSRAQFFYKKTLIVANKKDLPSAEENYNLLKKALEPEFIPVAVSAGNGEGLEYLKKRIFSMLNVIRVYSKIPGKKADLNDPFTLKKGSSVMTMAKAVHKDFSQNLKYARIWSKNKYQGQKVNRNHILEDEDVIELHI